MRTLALVVALASLTAAAQDAQVKKYFNAAVTLYENLEYEKALKQLGKAKAKANTPDDEAKVSLLEGVVLADMGREDKALAAFKAGFSVDLEAKLPVEVGPKVQAVAEKARASVRKLLAPTLEAQRLEEERKAAEEKQRAEAEAARLAEAKRLEAEERAKNQPPPATVTKAATGPSARSLSWIPGVVGLGAAGAATGLLLSASARHTALLNGTAPPEQAAAYRDQGKTEATLGYVFTGVAVAGVATAALMFALGAPADAPVVSVVPLREGGLLAVTVPLGGGAP